MSLSQIQQDDCQSAELREEASAFDSDSNLKKDLQDALNMMLTDVDNWRYAEAGYPVEAVWTRNKWRLYPRFDLPTAALLNVVQDRWSAAFQRYVGEDHLVVIRKARLAKLKELNAPDVIIQNGYRMLKEAKERIGLGVGVVEPWSQYDPGADATVEPATNSIFMQREHRQAEIRDSVSNRGYGVYGGGNPLIALVNAEIRALRHAFPDVPLYVMKVDLQDFYPSIPHSLISKILERLGIEHRRVAFVERFLQLPMRRDDGSVATARRGVPMGSRLSDLLANLSLTLLERFVQQQAAVRIVRQIDDIFVLAPDPEAILNAWRRINQFCDAAGLAVNQDKCGTVCIGGGAVPDEAPAGQPTWGMLALDAQGEWTVNETAFQSHLDQTREHVKSTTGILAKVRCYNLNARFLLANLCCSNRLGSQHRMSVSHAVRRFHLEFAGPGRSFLDDLVAELRRRSRLPETLQIPESWLYWPVTAGGLGLLNPLIELSQYSGDTTQGVFPEKREADWDRLENKWSEAYGMLTNSIEPAELEQTPELKALVNDFIQRGKEISGGRQHDLSSYWQWILAIFGPEIVASFGTFRFLITELVPLRLINRQLSGAASQVSGD